MSIITLILCVVFAVIRWAEGISAPLTESLHRPILRTVRWIFRLYTLGVINLVLLYFARLLLVRFATMA